jgi:hypothetical protein
MDQIPVIAGLDPAIHRQDEGDAVIRARSTRGSSLQVAACGQCAPETGAT